MYQIAVCSLLTLLLLSMCETKSTNDVILSLMRRLDIQKVVIVVNDLYSNAIKFAPDMKYFVKKKVYISYEDYGRIVLNSLHIVNYLDHKTLVVFQSTSFVKSFNSIHRFRNGIVRTF